MKTKSAWMWTGAIAAAFVLGAAVTTAQKKLFPQPEPRPAPPPKAAVKTQNPMAELSRSQNFSASRVSSYNREGGPRDNFWIPVDGREVTLAEIKGPGAITHIWATHRDGGRDLILRMYWEGSGHPSVEAPLGDFFGVAMGLNAEINSVPLQASSNGRSRNSWWYMPFNKSAKVTVSATNSEANRKLDTVALYFYIDYRTFARPIEDLHYFHARFTESDPPERGRPVTFLEAEGDGHFLGVVMGNRLRSPGWFGEGDDIFTVDGIVSHLGTGSEDYFCDAWGFRVFSDLYHGVPALEGRRIGDRLSAYRFHILDPIPFRKSFKFEIEHWPWMSTLPNSGRDYFSALAFWYQTTVHEAWPRLETIVSNQPWDPTKGRWHTPGCLEAEDLALLDYRSRAVEEDRPPLEIGPETDTSEVLQAMLHYHPRPTRLFLMPNLSGDHMLAFDSGGDGSFTLAVPAEEAGDHHVNIYFVRAPDYGIARLSVNGEPVGEPADTFLKTDDLTRPVWPPLAYDLGTVRLEKGLNRFRFTVDSKNPKAEGYRLGVDCLVLEKE
jgi:hypothetical protein